MAAKAPRTRLQEMLGLDSSPVALAFFSDPPAGVSHIATPAAAGCGYWRLAAEGQIFYTTPSDHYGCTIGAHTHGVALPPDKTSELQSVVATMIQLQYIQSKEVERLAHRSEPFRIAAYAPLAKAPFEADIVLVRGNARQLMLLSEAAQAAGVASGGAMGRPACAVVPETIDSDRVLTSFGCVGNRVYTALPNDEFYLAVPGHKLNDVMMQLEAILAANRELEAFHLARAKASSESSRLSEHSKAVSAV